MARTMPADTDVVIFIEPKSARRLRVRADFDPTLVKNVRIVVADIDAAEPAGR